MIEPPALDFGEVEIGGHPRKPIRMTPPEGAGPVTIISLHAIDPLGAATFRAPRLQRGTTLKPGDTLVIDIACSPATHGLIERELILRGTARPHSGPPRPIEHKVRVRAQVVKDSEVGLAKVGKAAAAATAAGAQSDGQLEAKQPSVEEHFAMMQQPTGLTSKGDPTDGESPHRGKPLSVGEAREIIPALFVELARAQAEGIGRLQRDLLTPRRPDSSLADSLVGMSVSFMIGGLAPGLATSLTKLSSPLLKKLVPGEQPWQVRKSLQSAERSLHAAIKGAIKSGLKTATQSALSSSGTGDIKAFLDAMQDELNGHTADAVIDLAAGFDELGAVAGVVLGQHVLRLRHLINDAADLQYNAALKAVTQWMVGRGDSSEDLDSRPGSHLTEVPRGLLHLRVKDHRVIGWQWPGLNPEVTKQLVAKQGKRPLRSLEASMRITVVPSYGAPYTFEKHWGDTDARVPTGHGAVHLARHYAGAETADQYPTHAAIGANLLAVELGTVPLEKVFK
ncbi:MAG: hypothetical protein KJO07_23570 [Deltaproteobacteria bacterium]|nr:hypothetical protein [Deltaproteobacteria bacterium]